MVSALGIDGTRLVPEVHAPIASRRARVLVVDDHRTFAELLSGALDAEPDPPVRRPRPDLE